MVVLTPQLIKAKTKHEKLEDVKNLNLWGQEVSDLSVLAQMPNVEVLSLSVNKIPSLKDFRHCSKLQELFLRKNEIKDIQELRYLKGLPNLSVLWLNDNPCAEHPDFRLHVARNLPNVTKLDNQPITPEEQEACKHLPELPPYTEADDQRQQPSAAAAPTEATAGQQQSKKSSKNVFYAIMALINDVESEEELTIIKAAVEQQLAALRA
jgi:hypothetical protein